MSVLFWDKEKNEPVILYDVKSVFFNTMILGGESKKYWEVISEDGCMTCQAMSRYTLIGVVK